jgi:putative toxin-antitoxin system antitoxin component (TIGR02293 family)
MATAAHKPISHFVPPVEAQTTPYVVRSLGLKFSTLIQFMSQIQKGFNWTLVSNFLKNTGFSQQELADFLEIPIRTFARRRESGGLSQAESERLLRLAEIFDDCLELFDNDREAAHSWLFSHVRGLGNASPLSYARTEIGAREVRNLIGRLLHGVFA